MTNKNANEQLLYAAAEGDLAAADKAINAAADVNARDKNLTTPLHHAAAKGQTSVIDLLISKGADINAKDRDGSTPMHYAAAHRQPDAIQQLLKHGAIKDVCNMGDLTPAEIAFGNGDRNIAALLESSWPIQNGKTIDGGHANQIDKQREVKPDKPLMTRAYDRLRELLDPSKQFAFKGDQPMVLNDIAMTLMHVIKEQDRRIEGLERRLGIEANEAIGPATESVTQRRASDKRRESNNGPEVD